jgi:uncharacterized surface anchored protein
MSVVNYAYRVINGGKSKNNEDQATSKLFFIKKKSVNNGTVQQEIPLTSLTDEEPVSNLSEYNCNTFLERESTSREKRN